MRSSLATRKKHDVEILLFREVNGTEQIVSDMLSGKFAATLIDASMVPDLFVVLVAASTALRRFDDGDKVTKNIYTDILYQLSPTRNISHALNTFGINNKSKDIIAVIPDPTDEKIAAVREHISGSEVEASQLSQIQNVETQQNLQKVYSIRAEELQTSCLVDSIVTRLACRDIK